MMKTPIRLLIALVLPFVLISPTFADTIRLKDGSVIHGQVIAFKDQQFTVLIGGGAKGRRGQTTIYVEDIDSIEFDNNSSNQPTIDTSSTTNSPVMSQPPRTSTQPDSNNNVSPSTTQPTTG